MLTGIVDALETLYYDDQVKEKVFGNIDGSLRELLTNVDEHEALIEIMQAVEDLLITDELMQVILGDYDPLSTENFDDIDSSLNCSTDEVETQYQVYYTDENGNEIEEPAIITVDPSLTGMELYEEIQDKFYEQYPGCAWDTICDMSDEVKVDSSKKSFLNSSVHDNPALKTLVERVRNVAQQVSAVSYVADGNNGYKIIVRGMDSADFEGIADSLGIELDSIKPLDDGFAVVVQEEKLNGSCVNCDEDTELQDGSMHYRQYFITGSDSSGYVAISPYGKYSPKVYRTIDEAKADIDKDIKLRFPERS